ncbi:MAG: TatD family hydrolase [Lachnospiraceae bacterium]|nr:TatD family hydrolase [Lachnospiraceae bacterium]
MAYIDAHCHLGSRQFDHDRNEMIARMLAKGVSKAIIICCGPHDLEQGIRLRDENPGFMLAMGIHPQDMERDSSPGRMERFRNAVKEVRPDMIGEIGLDYYSHPHTKAHQKEFFIEQLKLAAELDLPVDIHSRRASGDTLSILKEYPARGIIHSYSGSVEMAALYVRLGYYISFGASVLFPNAKKPAGVIASVPMEKLLIETDAPYQSPVRYHRHEPEDVVNIYRAVSAVRQVSMEELEKTVGTNFDRVFSRP